MSTSLPRFVDPGGIEETVLDLKKQQDGVLYCLRWSSSFKVALRKAIETDALPTGGSALRYLNPRNLQKPTCCACFDITNGHFPDVCVQVTHARSR